MQNFQQSESLSIEKVISSSLILFNFPYKLISSFAYIIKRLNSCFNPPECQQKPFNALQQM